MTGARQVETSDTEDQPQAAGGSQQRNANAGAKQNEHQ
jgi:hypothetical protein